MVVAHLKTDIMTITPLKQRQKERRCLPFSKTTRELLTHHYCNLDFF